MYPIHNGGQSLQTRYRQEVCSKDLFGIPVQSKQEDSMDRKVLGKLVCILLAYMLLEHMGQGLVLEHRVLVDKVSGNSRLSVVGKLAADPNARARRRR